MPKREQPRENPAWSDERAGYLQDFVWHDYERWEIVPDGNGVIGLGGPQDRVVFVATDKYPWLVIWPAAEPDGRAIVAPHAQLMNGSP